ncbi:T-complex protein 1 subunit eta [Portunus trituberculatus]|uniref:T-complex protein 1 subunit eta n=1 Tax=Portunus trituberculatus TaxID=210409 RepID=A0A5B7K9K5_PORTR|nr:T-complex protein 1 subunit eta [Portunus trituberculatus]
MFCAGRVVEQDLKRTIKACGGAIMTTAHDLCDSVLGTCKRFEEQQIGAERCVGGRSYLVLRVCVASL